MNLPHPALMRIYGTQEVLFEKTAGRKSVSARLAEDALSHLTKVAEAGSQTFLMKIAQDAGKAMAKKADLHIPHVPLKVPPMSVAPRTMPAPWSKPPMTAAPKTSPVAPSPSVLRSTEAAGPSTQRSPNIDPKSPAVNVSGGYVSNREQVKGKPAQSAPQQAKPAVPSNPALDRLDARANARDVGHATAPPPAAGTPESLKANVGTLGGDRAKMPNTHGPVDDRLRPPDASVAAPPAEKEQPKGHMVRNLAVGAGVLGAGYLGLKGFQSALGFLGNSNDRPANYGYQPGGYQVPMGVNGYGQPQLGSPMM